jgi:hypothetical protein
VSSLDIFTIAVPRPFVIQVSAYNFLLQLPDIYVLTSEDVSSAFAAYPDDRETVQKACEDQLKKQRERLKSAIERTNDLEDSDEDIGNEYVPPHPGGHRRASLLPGNAGNLGSYTSPILPQSQNLLEMDQKLALLPNFDRNAEMGSMHSIQFRSSRMSNSNISASPSSLKLAGSTPMLNSSPLRNAAFGSSPVMARGSNRESVKGNPIASAEELSQLKTPRAGKFATLPESDNDVNAATGDDAV